MKILIVEDQQDLNNIICKRFRNEKYQVVACYDGKDALETIIKNKFDVIVLDIMLPYMNGYEVVKSVREKGINTPVIFLTAKDGIEDKVKGLDIGANDYMVKPFSFEELLARVRVLTRKTNKKNELYSIADLTIDTASHVVKRGKNEINLSLKEFSILEYMIKNKGIVVTREQIENNSPGFANDVSSNVVDVFIRFLRKKIDDNYDNKLIHTIRGVGYVLRED